MARQLHLFKGPRQKGELPPSPSEFALHCAIADAVRLSIKAEWIFLHIPNGERRDEVAGARLKRMGVLPGAADLMFLGPGPSVVFLELKRRGGRMSEAQRDFMAHATACGCVYHMTSDFEDAIGTLRDLGIVRMRVSR